MNIQGNWIDLIIIVILLYFASEAWRVGFWIILADFLGFLVSLLIALKGYVFASDLLRENFQLSHSLSNALGFLIVAGFSEAILSFFLVGIIKNIPYKFWKKPWNNIAGLIPSLGQGLVIISFILMLALSLPLAPKIKSDITRSVIGGYLVDKTSGLEAHLNEIFGGLIKDSLTYLTVQPGSSEMIPLTVESQEIRVDEAAEVEMQRLVNNERTKRGLSPVTRRADVIPVARSHAEDMWKRQYFGHVSPDGEDIGVRLEKVGVNYLLAGENLALAPTVQTAHTGLMNSEGHRANILESRFRQLGIGVIDNGIYGKMFVQIFTD